ncbi:DUF1570 domain-containing protein [Pedobacter glucosidilyticus]|uniref:DUF1570 domain-containing protein n=1 Tax=Pedobacter glucosidilyticus TaxID=1122941 RepID=UPI0026EAF7AD|nr:DUF1570 domain-containing protein [Pedobacter glucosidilyticus]
MAKLKLVKLPIIILLLLCSFSSYSQKLAIKEIGFSLKPEDRAKIERLATYEVKIFNGLFKDAENDSLTIHINLYHKGKDFRDVLQQFGLKGLTESGFYSPITNQSYVLYQSVADIEIILHEMSHALLRNSIRNPPRWFNEGLAEFLESLKEENYKIQVNAQFHYLDKMKADNRNIPANISAFLNSHNSWQDKNRVHDMYTISYCMVYYIIKQNPLLISKMANMMRKGINTEQIFNTLFGGIDNFERNFNFYYR